MIFKRFCSPCFCLRRICSNDMFAIFCLNMIFKVLLLEISLPLNFCSYLDAWLGSRSVVWSHIRPSIHPFLIPSFLHTRGAHFGYKSFGCKSRRRPLWEQKAVTKTRGARFGDERTRCPLWPQTHAAPALIYSGLLIPDILRLSIPWYFKASYFPFTQAPYILFLKVSSLYLYP